MNDPTFLPPAPAIIAWHQLSRVRQDVRDGTVALAEFTADLKAGLQRRIEAVIGPPDPQP